MNFPILSSLILLPSIGALFLFFTKSDKKNNFTGKYVALFTSYVNFLISIYLWFLFDPNSSNFQFVEEEMKVEESDVETRPSLVLSPGAEEQEETFFTALESNNVGNEDNGDNGDKNCNESDIDDYLSMLED